MITLKNCRLIPELTEDYDDVMADILLDGKVIREINAPGTGTKGETVMDLEGKTVMPGLFDLHMHFNFDTVNVYELRARKSGSVNGISPMDISICATATPPSGTAGACTIWASICGTPMPADY